MVKPLLTRLKDAFEIKWPMMFEMPINNETETIFVWTFLLDHLLFFIDYSLSIRRCFELNSLFSFDNFFCSLFPVYIRFHHHHHHVMPQARLSLTLSRHFPRSFIASGRSLGLHPLSSHSCCLYAPADRPTFDRPYAGVHRSTSLMNSFLLLRQCPEYLVRLTWIVFVMGGKWPYSWRLVGCCHQDLFNIARNILV